MKRRVVAVGGGTGTFVVLSGLKKYDLELSVIVSMMDSGGSTGRLRDQLGVLPPGDLRQCLVALSDASELWRQLFLYRFETGDLDGHNFGNIFITALEKTAKNYQEVVDTAAYILKTRGAVIPVTFDRVNLCVIYEDGEMIETENLIDTTNKTTRIKKVFLRPNAKANQKAVEAILEADYLIIGPGDLYTSLIPNLVVDGIKEAIIESKAPIINVMNLMTKRGQTTNYAALDHISDLEKYLGKKIEFVLINSTPISEMVKEAYAKESGIVVADNLKNSRVIKRLDLLSTAFYNKLKADHVARSILRHDSDKIAAAIYDIIKV